MTTTLTTPAAGPAVIRLDIDAYTIATDAPQSDGTIDWDATTIAVVEAHAGDACGPGYAYCDASAWNCAAPTPNPMRPESYAPESTRAPARPQAFFHVGLITAACRIEQAIRNDAEAERTP